MPRKPKLRSASVYTPFKRTKSNDNGGFTGYANVKGCLDSHGTIMVDGCYVQGIPDLIKKGFVPDTHGEATNGVPVQAVLCGFFTDAKEDEYGLWVEAVFHDTEFAQEIRTQVQERIDAGKECGMSIGFFINDSFIIKPEDYERELPKYLKPEFLEQGLEDAMRFPWGIEICTKITVYEASLTVIPSNTASLVEEVRSGRPTDFSNIINIANEIFSSNFSHEQKQEFAKKLNSQRSLSLLREIITMTTRGGLPEEHREKLGKVCDALEDNAKSLKRMRDSMDEADEHHKDAVKSAKLAAKHLDDMLAKRDDDDDKRTANPSDIMKRIEKWLK